MIYLSTHAADLTRPCWLLHLPSLTLAEMRLNAGDNGNHLLVTLGTTPPSPEVFAAFHDTLEMLSPDSGKWMVHATLPPGTPLPPYILFASSIQNPKSKLQNQSSILIHYPAFGFAAGVHADGSKIPPTWRDPAIFTPEQRSHFLAQAAETLIQELAALGKPSPSQAT